MNLNVYLLRFYFGFLPPPRCDTGGLLSYFRGLLGSREMRILILGLDGAGKTTILYRYENCYYYYYFLDQNIKTFLNMKHYCNRNAIAYKLVKWLQRYRQSVSMSNK